jgi:hypothetical protein
MILNKFRTHVFHTSSKALGPKLLALSIVLLVSCNKSSDINGNTSYVALTHVAYNLDPILLSLDGDSLFTTPLSFGQTTGTPGNPYNPAVSRVSLMSIFLPSDTAFNIHGNAAFRQGAHYSIFFFDSLVKNVVGLIVLQDNTTILQDTVTYYRYLNFALGDTLWGLELINNRKDKPPYAADTVIISPSAFVGLNTNPASYPMTSTIRTGNYNVFAFPYPSNPIADTSIVVPLGPIQIDSLVNYNIYLQGVYGSDTTAANKFQLKYIPLNLP